MKILEAQNAILTNVEVYEFLSAQAKEYQEQRRRGPNNLETVRKEVLHFLETFPSPLSQQQQQPPFGSAAIPRLVRRLRPYQLTKGEVVMLLNLRPAGVPTLNAVVEEMEARFAPEQQEDIVRAVAEVLGAFPPPEEQEEEGEEGGGDGGDGGDGGETTERGGQ